ncbi:DUF1310 family protein [Listeria monocytogenes serotype 1/2a]|nr:DUF1310 family protein [Listeria monocytogenes]ECC2754229.1 DUF1310 family protein [Listeria monocytogenes]EHC5237847.1 DUF1310 family protein [Listeria monocytogenes serotype 1/2a]EHC6257091.1 DUF1310 family protein [Listeria monocytogenes serotype 1/2a]
MKKRWVIVLGITVMTIFGLGVKFYMDEEGVIQSYEIDEKSINHNPMGGINVTVIINENPELYIKYTLDKFNGKLECGSASIAGKLSKLLGRWEENKKAKRLKKEDENF